MLPALPTVQQALRRRVPQEQLVLQEERPQPALPAELEAALWAPRAPLRRERRALHRQGRQALQGALQAGPQGRQVRRGPPRVQAPQGSAGVLLQAGAEAPLLQQVQPQGLLQPEAPQARPRVLQVRRVQPAQQAGCLPQVHLPSPHRSCDSRPT